MIDGRRRFQTFTVARTFALCVFNGDLAGDPFARDVVAGVGADRESLRRFCRLNRLSFDDVRFVARRVCLARDLVAAGWGEQ